MPTRRAVFSAAGAFTATAFLKHSPLWAQEPSPEKVPVSLSDPMSYVNPELRPALEDSIRTFGSNPPLTLATLPNMRNRSFAKPPLPSPPVSERRIPGPPGSPDLRVFVVGNSSGASKPAVLHIHGGGYVTGSAADAQRDIQELSLAHNCVAVSVDYRLAPETHFPGSLEDNYSALSWMHSSARELGIDVSRIALKGESAGGGHAAALAIAARDRGKLPICLQVLIYPMLDDRTGSSRKMPPYLGNFIWTSEANRFGWQSLLGVAPGTTTVPANAVPARVNNLNGLPPAFIGVGSIDLFAPEDMEYAQRLTLAGVPVEMNVVPGGFHAFDAIAAGTSLSQQFEHSWHRAIDRAFSAG